MFVLYKCCGLTMVDQKEYYQKYYLEHKEEYLLRNRKQIRNRKEYNKIYQRKLHLKRKTEIFELLGNKCVRCGFSDPRALQIDHINGGGCKEIKMFKSHSLYYIYILAQIKNGSKDYQI